MGSKALPIGSTFKAVTKNKRVIDLAKVIDVDAEGGMHCRWFDCNGKHYERFTEDEISEFRSFEVVHTPPEVKLCCIQHPA